MLLDALIIAIHFARTRWSLDFRDRGKLEAWHQARLHRFIREDLPRASYYRNCKVKVLSDLPPMDNTLMMTEFEARNTRGVRLDEAFEIGLKAANRLVIFSLAGRFLRRPVEWNLWQSGSIPGTSAPPPTVALVASFAHCLLSTRQQQPLRCSKMASKDNQPAGRW